MVLQVLFYVSVVWLVLIGDYTRWSLLVFVLAPLAVTNVNRTWQNHSSPLAVVPAQAGTIQFQMLSTLIIIASVVSERMLGLPFQGF